MKKCLDSFLAFQYGSYDKQLAYIYLKWCLGRGQIDFKFHTAKPFSKFQRVHSNIGQ